MQSAEIILGLILLVNLPQKGNEWQKVMALSYRSNIALTFVLMALIAGSIVGCSDLSQESETKKIVVPKSSRLSGIKSWAYQLQKIEPSKIAVSASDLVVIDYSKDGTDGRAFSAADIAQMRIKPNGKRRIVLAYLSIGEAESYRFYWQNDWREQRPAWLGPENPNWPKNYKVRYWHKKWQSIIFGHRKAYLDKIIAAGFDGIYLDIVDAYEFWGDQRPSAADDMVQFVARLAGYGRSKNKDFLVVPQNGEGLLKHAIFTSSINAFAKEDLLFGVQGDGVTNSPEEIARNFKLLNIAKQAGKPVFVIEYLSNQKKISQAKGEFEKMGFVSYFSERQLTKLY